MTTDTPRTDALDVKTETLTHLDNQNPLNMHDKTDTPRTDAFYPSDADFWEEEAKRYCSNSQYWRERAEKAEAEVERLRVALQSCYWATNPYDGKYIRACDNVATIAIEALKTQDK